MWLLNHSSARKFEVPVLRKLGYEVFTPKIYPNDANFRSASVDFREDANLTIPAEALEILNKADWYEGPDRKTWDIANAYFDMAFFILFNVRGVEKMCRRFKGELLWRAYGLAGENTYSRVLTSHPQYISAKTAFRKLGSRFWFAEGYSNLHEVEEPWLQSRAVYLPLGMAGADSVDPTAWSGGDKRIFFVCPDIGFNPPYAEIYNEFKHQFKGFPYAIGGAQSIAVSDPNVLGYLPFEEHQKNMKHLQLMFYHSREPRHIHYHPFESVRAGMPLIFMGGGMLDRMGGKDLPGRARTWDEARGKVQRILDGDQKFIERVRATQTVLLDGMKGQNLVPHWEIGLQTLTRAIESRTTVEVKKTRRIAVLTSHEDLEQALIYARDIASQAREASEPLKVVLGIERPKCPKRNVDAPPAGEKHDDTIEQGIIDGIEDIPARIFKWSDISRVQAERSLIYAGVETALDGHALRVPDDQINFFQDCDLWVIVGGRVDKPVLPLKPIVTVIAEDITTYSKPKSNDVHLARLGILPRPDAVIVGSEGERSHIALMEGIDPAVIHVVNASTNDNSLLEVVLECL
jgi:hypothetical protein